MSILALDKQVPSSDDDIAVNKTGSAVSLTDARVLAGYSATAKVWGSGLRFTSITIPKSSTIVAAKLTFRCRLSNSGTVCNTRISAEDVDNPGDFSGDNYASFMTRYGNRTSAVVDWDGLAAWVAGNDYDSPEIKTVIQELVNRADWDSGDALVIFWEDFDERSTSSGAQRRAESYDGDSSNAPKLHIEFIYRELASARNLSSIRTLTAARNLSPTR